jgi:hypothetical protein
MGAGPSSCTSTPSAALPLAVAEGAGARSQVGLAVSLTFASAAELQRRVRDELARRPELFAPADAAIRAGAELSARRNSWGGPRAQVGERGVRTGRLGGGFFAP